MPGSPGRRAARRKAQRAVDRARSLVEAGLEPEEAVKLTDCPPRGRKALLNLLRAYPTNADEEGRCAERGDNQHQKSFSS